ESITPARLFSPTGYPRSIPPVVMDSGFAGKSPRPGMTPCCNCGHEKMTATRPISFTLNGEQVSARIASHHSLLEVVRNDFSLYGARESCGQGLCGCCTLIVDGRAVSGCLYLAAFADGATVETVEHLD